MSKIIQSVIIWLVQSEGRAISLTKVVVQNGDINTALRKFKVKVARSGVPSEVKKRKFHIKPGVERRIKKEEGIKNSHKRNHN